MQNPWQAIGSKAIFFKLEEITQSSLMLENFILDPALIRTLLTEIGQRRLGVEPVWPAGADLNKLSWSSFEMEWILHQKCFKILDRFI